VAHNSGGPREDIIQTNEEIKTGFLSSTVLEYADSVAAAVELLESEQQKNKKNSKKSPDMDSIRYRVRASTQKFSDEIFSEKIITIFHDAISI
jgi:hypothetical protein